MKKKKLLRFLALALTLCLSLSGFAVLAEEDEPVLPMMGEDVNVVYGINSTSQNADGTQTYAASLIKEHNVILAKKIVGGSVVPGWCVVTLSTICDKEMAKIGYTIIEIIRTSKDGSEVSTRFQINDYFYENSASAPFEREFYIDTGYYYHVHVIHYAKEKGWFFPQSQSIEDWTGKLYFA